MSEEQEASIEEIRRANDELWGYIQANPEIHVRAHMTRNLSFLYEKAYASTVSSKPSPVQEQVVVSTASLIKPFPGLLGADSSQILPETESGDAANAEER